MSFHIFPSDKPHYPFELPKGWVWCKLDDIAYVASGSTPEKSSFVPKGIPYIKMYNLRNQKIDFEYKPQYITAEIHNGKLQRSRTEVGDLIMNIVGPLLGKLAIIPPSLPQANFNQAAVLIRPYLHKDNINVYLKAYLEEMSEINSISTKGSAGQVNISLTQSQNMRIPLPPLPEIERIIKNLKYWLSFVDNIEENKEKLQDSIRQVKSKILDLAIHGKLVPQDPNDEPAIELLKRINPKAEIITDNGHYQNLPKGWCLTTLESITNYGSCVNVSVQEIPKDAWVLELEDIEKDSAKILCARHKKDREIKGVRHRFKAGDILYSKLRTYLNKVLIAPNEGFCTTEIIPISVKLGIHNKYICHVLRSQAFLDYTAQCGYGVKMPRLSTKDAQNGIIPLPPYNEQLRIVSMVEKLLADLGTIEESLAR